MYCEPHTQYGSFNLPFTTVAMHLREAAIKPKADENLLTLTKYHGELNILHECTHHLDIFHDNFSCKIGLYLLQL